MASIDTSVYVTVSIGNTDNKLTQQEWHNFVDDCNNTLKLYGNIHFFGGSNNYENWQNVAWILETSKVMEVLGKITKIRKHYNQESAFVTWGTGKFI